VDVEAYLDEARLASTNLAYDFELLARLLGRVLADQIKTRKRSTIYESRISEDLDLATLLFHPGHLDTDIRLALQVQLEQLLNWDGGDQASTAIFSRGRREQGAAVCCLMLKVHAVNLVTDGIYDVGDLQDLRAFLLEVPEILDLNELEYIEHSAKLLDRLVFKPGIGGEIRKFSRPYKAIREDLHAALVSLNDFLGPLLDDGRFGAELAAQFSALSGWEISPESAQTHRNRQAMREREVLLNGHSFTCEWHLKIEPHRDRIHFHSFDARIGNGRQILVGIFCEHLST
jgi:hypothetical protein